MSASLRTALIWLALPVAVIAATDRITNSPDSARTTAITGFVSPVPQTGADLGLADPATHIAYATLLLKPDASLESFLAEQQMPSSMNFHRWLTPESFADRFGLTANDIAKLTGWLASQGLTVNDVARGRHWITFSGDAGKVGRAFHTEIHRYRVDGETHIAMAFAPSVPAAFANVIAGVTGIDDFAMKPLYIRASPGLTSGNLHYLAPEDVATIYDIAPLYAASVDGTGQKIAVVGQTDINIADIRLFRLVFNLPPNDPQVVLYGPDPGISTSDLPEADLDIEWSGAVARNATIVYVNSVNVNISAQYAVDQNLAPVMTMSYGQCELSSSLALRSVAQQASAQGITWMVASGDSGAATCDRNAVTPQASKGNTVSFPASVPEVTAVGGTEFAEGSGAYWQPVNTTNGGSAISWIPEVVWNDSAIYNGLVAGGGGPSAVYPKPFWQSGRGVPADGARDIPDVSFSASAGHDGYIVFTGGEEFVFGGTSVSSPVFAGIVVLLNQAQQAKGANGGLGNINPALYQMARVTSDVFHDVVAGNNMVPCQQDTPGCVNGQVGYSAGTGYDPASGLGSVDAFHMVTEWMNGASTTTTLSASPASVGLTGPVQLNASVAAVSGSGVGSVLTGVLPTGTITFLANDNAIGIANLDSSGNAGISVDASVVIAGNNSVTALYSGDSTFLASSGQVTVTLTLSGSGSAVVASVAPDPVYQMGTVWPYTLTLTEKNGVPTTLTAFTINGVNNLGVFATYRITANETMSVQLSGKNLITPLSRVFVISGIDDSGKTWSDLLSVPFLSSPTPPFAPSISLTAAPAMVQQNPLADPSCQWQQNLVLKETGGFLVELTSFTPGSSILTSEISQLFGTTRLAPYGSLQANVCWNSATSAGLKSYSIVGVSPETGVAVSASASGTLAAASSAPAAFTVSPQRISISGNGSATLHLNFTTGSSKWSASVTPLGHDANWLTAATLAGSGSGDLVLQSSATGLSNGVYSAILTLQAADAIPQVITVPVSLVVGGSPFPAISGVTNAASYGTACAPGMIMSVFGSGLAPVIAIDGRVPLPLEMNGVSATVNGISAPFYFISPNQLNIQVPYEAGAGPAILAVNNNGQVATFSFVIAPSAPGIFADISGSLVPYNTGQQGQILLAYVTGEGDATPTLATGATPASSTPISFLPAPRLPVILTVGGVQANVVFAGIPSSLVGLIQINFTVPPNAPTGLQPVVVSVGGVAAPPVMLNVTAAATN